MLSALNTNDRLLRSKKRTQIRGQVGSINVSDALSGRLISNLVQTFVKLICKYGSINGYLHRQIFALLTNATTIKMAATRKSYE